MLIPKLSFPVNHVQVNTRTLVLKHYMVVVPFSVVRDWYKRPFNKEALNRRYKTIILEIKILSPFGIWQTISKQTVYIVLLIKNKQKIDPVNNRHLSSVHDTIFRPWHLHTKENVINNRNFFFFFHNLENSTVIKHPYKNKIHSYCTHTIM
jgi:hypothetical protein